MPCASVRTVAFSQSLHRKVVVRPSCWQRTTTLNKCHAGLGPLLSCCTSMRRSRPKKRSLHIRQCGCMQETMDVVSRPSD